MLVVFAKKKKKKTIQHIIRLGAKYTGTPRRYKLTPILQ